MSRFGDELIELAELQLALSTQSDHLIDTIGATGVAGIRGALASTTIRQAVLRTLKGFFKEHIGDYDRRQEILREHFKDVGAVRDRIAQDSALVFYERVTGL